jgi:hypothetical protein
MLTWRQPQRVKGHDCPTSLLYQLPLVVAPNTIFFSLYTILLILGSRPEYKNYSACTPSLAYIVWFNVLIPCPYK